MPKAKVIPLPTAKPAEQTERYKRRKDGLYQLELRYEDSTGKQCKKSFYGKTQAEAKKKRDAFTRQLNDGINVAAAEKTTVKEWADKWLSIYKANVSPNTLAAYKYDIERINTAIGHRKLATIAASDVQEIMNQRAGLSASSVKKTYATLKSLFEAARRDRLITYNPCDGLAAPDAVDGTHEMIDQGMCDLIASTWREHRFGPAAMLMLFAGLRRGEAMAFDCDRDINRAEQIISVRESVHFEGNASVIGPPKTDAGLRDIPIMPQLKDVLKDAHGLILPSTSGMHMTSSAFKRAHQSYITFLEEKVNGVSWRWAKEEQRAKWRHVNLRCHDLRHTFCSLLYDAGVSVKTAQLWMGHDDVDVTMRIYTHLSEAKKDADIKAAKKHFAKMSVNLSVKGVSKAVKHSIRNKKSYTDS